MGWQTLISLIIVMAAGLWLAKELLRFLRGASMGGCGGCPNSKGCASSKGGVGAALDAKPLVQITALPSYKRGG